MEPIAVWLIDNAMAMRSLSDLLDGVCRRLAADGMPVVRGNISLSIIDPTFRARSCVWRPATGADESAIPHEREQGEFQQSPIGAMFAAQQLQRHWIIDAAGRREFDLLDDIAQAGGVDYFAILQPFENPDFEGLRGIAFTMASNRPGGLTEAERARLVSISRLVAPIVYRLTLGDLAIALMDAYVGPPASRRILNGEVMRGAGETIEAVLMMADLSGFTALADASGLDLIERLDEHLEAMAAPVIARGGSVLKFMGDGMLAAFPITADLPQREACALALAAAREAIDRNRGVNARRAGETALGLDVALHCGEVFYGNVGAPGRLDFTVIGPAVNEVSRMEALAKTVGRNLVMSAEVAGALDAPTLSLGWRKLRGVERERELFGEG
jgi:adenylate cyclase